MSFLVDHASKTISPGALMVMYLTEEMDLCLHLQEIYALLGEEMTMTFLSIFGGRKLELPRVEKVREAFKTVSIYLRFEKLKDVNSEEDVIAQVAAEFDVVPGVVTSVRAKVVGLLKNLDEVVLDVARQNEPR